MGLPSTHGPAKSMIPEEIIETTPSAQQVADERRTAACARPRESHAGSPEEETHGRPSKNPFKKLFGRSKSHHVSAKTHGTDGHHAGGAGHGAHGNGVGFARSPSNSYLHKSGKAGAVLPSMALHNSNPFANGGRKPSVESPFAVLGTGTDVASPRQPHAAVLSSRNASHHLGNNMYTPSISVQSSRSLSYYQTEGQDKHEKMLPLPVKNPNDELPAPLKQPSVLLTDNFSFPSGVDGERKVIGEGGSSQVVTIVSNYRKSCVYALKRFKMFSYEEPEEFYQRCIKEYLIAKKLDGHINIIKTFYLMKVPSSATNGVKRSWAFVMQQCVQDMYYYTTLTGWHNKLLEEKWCCFKQIARGVRQMHNLGIAHRDIKLENILATDYGALKLTDFGVSTYAIESPDDPTSPRIKLKGFCGSPPHVPPEVMILSSEKRKKAPVPENKLEYDPFSMDMWALGIVMWSLIIPTPPFQEAHKDDNRYRQFLAFYDQFTRYSTSFRKPNVYKQGPGAEHPEFSKFQSTDATRVCLRLLDPDPDTRYTMEDLFNDPWFQSIETCVDEDTEEPVKVPELRKTTEGSDSPFAHDIFPSDEESTFANVNVTHTSNPFLDKSGHGAGASSSFGSAPTPRPSSSSRSLINIAEGCEPGALMQGSLELPTLDEEECNVANGLPTEVGCSSPLPPIKKISSLSLNDSYSNAGFFAAHHQDFSSPTASSGAGPVPNGHSLSRSSSVASRGSGTLGYGGPNSSGSSVTSIVRSRKKKTVHRHHECSGKPLAGTR
ncbi:AaceriAFR372Wp [[Ashbya] aceris (nom. inval.)]|nr:AaceriAFR372Wp [[Ashbya] aceris (nom. inval.)]